MSIKQFLDMSGMLKKNIFYFHFLAKYGMLISLLELYDNKPK